MSKAYLGGEDIILKLGDFSIITLDRENPMNLQAKIHSAFVRYNGMIPAGNHSTIAFEIGEYDGDKSHQEGHPYYLPSTEKMIDCRVDTYGRRVKLEILQVSPLEITAKDLTERQTAIRD